MFARKSLSAFVAMAAVVALSATQASAHAALVKSDPADKATVAAPKSVSLTFNEELTPAFSSFTMTMGGNMKMKVKTKLSKDHKTITGVPVGKMMAGVYKVAWHAAATDDGHKTQGTLTFTVK